MPVAGKKPAKEVSAKKPAAGSPEVGLIVNHPVTPDGRYLSFVAGSGAWQIQLGAAERADVDGLMAARRAVREAKQRRPTLMRT